MRKPLAVLLGTMVAVLCFGAVASAGIIEPTKVSATVSPHHLLGAPYTFTTSGKITFQHLYCPPGTTNPVYCTTITDRQACTGKLSLDVVLGPDRLLADASTTIKSTTGRVRGDCSYSIRVKLPTNKFTATSRFRRHQRGAYVHVHFVVKFLGNTILNAKSAHTQTVIAKLTQPRARRRRR